MKFQAVIFDFDGTLVDTFPGILKSWQMTFRELSLGEPDPAAVRAAIGPTKDVYLGMILGDRAAQAGEEALALYKMHYREVAPALTRVYDGIGALLDSLEEKRVPKAIASNKPFRQIMLLAESLGLSPRFDIILGPEKVAAGKPEPDLFLKCAEHFRLKPGEVLAAGDTDLDMIAGKSAGMARAAVLWGYSSREKLARFEPEYFVEEPMQLMEIVT